MKTMAQMQNEMLKKARYDGGYPRPVVMPIGVLALAKDEEEYNVMMRQSNIIHAALGIGLVVIAVVAIFAIAWAI